MFRKTSSKQILFLILVLVLAMTVVTACSQEQTAEGKTIGYIAAGTEYYYLCQESGVRKAAEEAGIDLVVLNSEGQADKEIANMEDMISRKVDMVLMMTTNAAAGQKALQLANEAEIPVILVGIGVEEGEGEALSLIDFDFKDMGRAAGAWVAENVDSGEVAIIEGLAGMNVAEPITEGFEEELAANPDLAIVAKQPADWSRQVAQDTATNLLQSHPNLKVIYGHNDDMSMGIINAVEEAGLADQVMVVSDNASAEGVEAIKAGKMVGSVAQSPAVDEGELAIKMAIDYLNGEEIPEHIREDLFLLTLDNIDQAKQWCYE